LKRLAIAGTVTAAAVAAIAFGESAVETVRDLPRPVTRKVPREICFGASKASRRVLGRTRGDPPVLRGPRSSRAVALTFDDGPTPLTPAVLNVLRTYEVKATFFVVGWRIVVRGGRQRLREVMRGGHEIGNHSCSHAGLDRIDAGEILPEFSRTNELIRDATGLTPRIGRAPYGRTNPSIAAAARLAGLKLVGWDVNPRDWEVGPRPTPRLIVRRVVGAARGGSIVVLHGTDLRQPTVRALPAIIRILRRQGLRLVTVSRLLAGRDREGTVSR
jgi:peptidoglycan/xylan/chitin deacetylase (PgdA/CDA1 family)